MDKDKQPERKTSKKEFNASSLKILAVASGIPGGLFFSVFSLIMQAQSGNKMWLAGVAAGVITSIYSGVDAYRLSNKQMKDTLAQKKQDDDQHPGPKL
ncbi:MAG: hypothetical protein H6867_11330 [Rhodospirillales bacterium]|nr:hypothetical protein [Rhodospirillales bacterium]MCB9996721.1 hypothetical protein [Rhodospirillales bacterium]